MRIAFRFGAIAAAWWLAFGVDPNVGAVRLEPRASQTRQTVAPDSGEIEVLQLRPNF